MMVLKKLKNVTSNVYPSVWSHSNIPFPHLQSCPSLTIKPCKHSHTYRQKVRSFSQHEENKESIVPDVSTPGPAV